MARSSRRRDANVIANRRLHSYSSPSSFSDVTVTRGPPRLLLQRRTPPISDNRVFHPLGSARPTLTFSGTVASAKRLYDAPRAISGGISHGGTHGLSRKAVQKAVAQFNRFGPHVDHQTRAIRAFLKPLQVPRCEMRRIRREVMHALGAAGGKVRKPRFTPDSQVTCRA